MKTKILILIIFICFSFQTTFAQNLWDFKLSYETQRLTESPFFLIASGDVNKNGQKELVVTDFGRFGDHIEEWKQWKENPTRYYNLFVLEWKKNELKLRWKKQWDMTKTKTDMEAHRYFLAFEAKQMTAWDIGDKVIVETIPPYLGLEWINGKYILHEQQGPLTKGRIVGSWALPWLNASCYQFTPKPAGSWPRECLVGIRDFEGKGKPKIVTIFEDKIGEKKYKQVLRVRKFHPDFPLEWEFLLDSKYYFSATEYIDRLNLKANKMLLMSALLLSDKRSYSSFIIEPHQHIYKLKPIKRQSKVIAKDLPTFELSLYDYPDIYLSTYDLPDVYLRSTRQKGFEEFWGYRFEKIKDGGSIPLLRKVTLKSDLSGFVKEDIDFKYHDFFLGVGFFDLMDIDGDGLDEIILVEETGKRKFEDEDITYSDIKDYIRILKWAGKEYKTMWVSPPYTKRGTKFLIDDIKNTGKKQLVVMTSSGTIQIWERK